MKLKDLLEFISENNLKENDEILVKINENTYRELKPENVNVKLRFNSNFDLYKYNFISL